MKYTFYETESKLYNLLMFPTLIHLKPEDFSKEDLNYADLADESVKDFLFETKELLQPYAKEIQGFYCEDLEIILMLAYLYPFWGKTDLEDYLKELLALEPMEILKSVVYAELIRDEKSLQQDFIPLAEEIAKDDKKLLSFVKERPYEDDTKWHLFCFIQDPLQSVRNYVDLMRRLRPFLEAAYERYRERLVAQGHQLVAILESLGDKGLSVLTNGIVREELIHPEEINILLSIANPYGITLYPYCPIPHLVWGWQMQIIFERMKEHNENLINQRVLLFKNLGDRTRYEVLKLIASGVTSTKAIAERLGVSSATISYHLSNLSTSQLISLNKNDSKFGYRINHELIQQSLEDLMKDLSPQENNSQE